ncbi:MAG TPA: hypothetical protein VMU26_03015 [Candidatus Polarisedimenticolia bacterium]|nr:hypothetical protein [Candidatus Polarisedimenticolia bacterium]
MRAALSWLAIGGLSIAGFVHYGNHIPQLKQLSIFQQSKETDPEGKDAETTSPSASDKIVSVASPREQRMEGAKANKPAEDLALSKLVPSDLIAPSPAGTGGVILHKTFSVATAATFSFLIPAHAASPQLHGRYQSLIRQAGQSSEEAADIDFLLMNEEQHAHFLSGQPADVLFSVDASHDQEVNFGLPASQNHPAKFYLVFRNSPSEGKKTVQADFTVDF